MMDTNDSSLLIHGLKFHRVGGAKIWWLANDLDLPEQSEIDILTAEEQACLAKLKSEVRRQEFVRSRWLLKKLAGDFSYHPSPRGPPVWPEGVVCSITHKSGHVGVAVEPSLNIQSIGIDFEDVSRVREPIKTKVFTRGESELVDRVIRESATDLRFWLTVIFSAKESLFKCLYPIGSEMFYFEDAETTAIDQKNQVLNIRLLKSVGKMFRPGFTVNAHFYEGEGGLIWTSVTLPIEI
jgi:4'-phosphopantetheinyl transferase EntD